MNGNIPNRVKREIVSFAKKNNVEKVILFGSRAKRTNTERSDIDIAIIGGNFNEFYWELKDKVHTLLSFDIVEFNDSISEELKSEIEKDGVLLYEKVG